MELCYPQCKTQLTKCIASYLQTRTTTHDATYKREESDTFDTVQDVSSKILIVQKMFIDRDCTAITS